MRGHTVRGPGSRAESQQCPGAGPTEHLACEPRPEGGGSEPAGDRGAACMKTPIGQHEQLLEKEQEGEWAWSR